MPPLPILGENAYDPRDHGALCDRCSLGPSPATPWRFVPPDPVDSPLLVAVLESPGQSDVDERRPACGKSGRVLDRALQDGGASRGQTTVTHTILCRPGDDGDLDLHLKKLARENRRRRRDGREQLLPPTLACRPRLLQELERAPFILALGKYAASTFIGEDVGITSVSGAPDVWEAMQDVEAGDGTRELVPLPRPRRIPYLATVHPAFVLRFGRYRQHFFNHVRRAVARASGRIEWVEPERTYAPTAAHLHNWFKDRRARGKRVAYDVETDFGKSAIVNALRCVGFADTRSAIVVPFRSPDPGEAAQGELFYRDASESHRMRRVIQAWMAESALEKSGWNEGLYDREVMIRNFGVKPASVRDGILLHRVLYPEVGHTLDYAGRDALDVAAWKRGHATAESSNMADLMAYNATDCVVTARLDEILWKRVRELGLERIVEQDHAIQEVCRQLHVNGIWIDQARRAELLQEWTARLERFRLEVVTIARNAGYARAIDPGPYAGTAFNPNSTQQVAELLFDHWGLDPAMETKMGDPSTEDAALRGIILGQADPTIRAWVISFRRLRRAVKVVGTYLEEDHAWPEDGRVHATWLPHGTGVGRRSCAKPNMQTLPFYLRGMIAAEPGRTLVYADWSQIHLRIIAGEAGDALLAEQFRTGVDPHKWHADLFYGAEWRAAGEELAAVQARVGSAFVPAGDRAGKGIDQALLAEMERIDSLGRALEGMRNSSKCVAAGTRVPVPGRGLLRIEDFAPEGLAADSFGEPRVEQVLGRNGEATQVQAAFYGGEVETVRITTSTGYVHEGRPEHPLLRESGEWARIDELHVGDALQRWSPTPDVFGAQRVSIPVNPWVSKRGPNAAVRTTEGMDVLAPKLPRIEVDPDFAYMLGAVQGDGTFSGSGVSLVGLAQDGVTGEIARIWRELGMRVIESVTTRGQNQPLTTVRVHSTPFRELLTRMGLTGRREWRAATFVDGRRPRHDVKKVLRVPEVIFRSPRDVVEAYLAGLFDTDGTMAGGSLSFTSSSREFVLDVKLLLDVFGVRTRLTPTFNARYQKSYWRLSLTRAATAAAAEAVPMRCARKRELLRSVAAGKLNRTKHAIADLPETIVSIERGKAHVYDVTVPKGHAFQAGGFVNHNTSTYCLMYLATLETFFETMTGVEDGPEGNLIYASFTMRQARRIYKLFWGAHPSLLKWGDRVLQKWRERGFVADSILGRPCWFLDGEDKNAIVNWPILSAEQSHAVPAILRAVEQVPSGYAGHGTGLIHDGHDSVTFEVPEDDAERVAGIVNGAMQSEHKGVPLNSEVKIGRHWDRQKKWKPAKA